MTTTKSMRSPAPETTTGCVLITDHRRHECYVVRRNSLGTGLLARIFGGSLDRRLADGQTPETGRLMAIRAQSLVSQEWRAGLAGAWRDMAERAFQRSTGRSKTPLCRDRILAAEHEVAALADALEAPVVLTARGVAMASALLADGTGPLYNRRSRQDLATALNAATTAISAL